LKSDKFLLEQYCTLTQLFIQFFESLRNHFDAEATSPKSGLNNIWLEIRQEINSRDKTVIFELSAALARIEDFLGVRGSGQGSALARDLRLRYVKKPYLRLFNCP
jgi:hypothetical protein